VSNVQNDWYVHFALLLGYTIKKYNPDLASISAEMVLLIPREHDIRQANMDLLTELGWKIKFEEDLTVEGINNLNPNWRRNLIKIRLWSWFEYRKILFLDADAMVLGDISLLLHDGFGISRAIIMRLTSL
jgi:alpha-N-acetylglucosamine transferase